VVFFVMSWCTSGVLLQLLPFIDNSLMGSIPRFQRFPCLYFAIVCLLSTVKDNSNQYDCKKIVILHLPIVFLFIVDLSIVR